MVLKVMPVLILLVSSIRLSECNKIPSTDDELQEPYGSVVYTIILFRHGDRTPIQTFPTDPIPMSFWKEGPGQLLKAGKAREYELGLWFRERYQHLLPEESYRYDRILVNSSDVDRAIMSAELFLAGLYPPDDNEMWNRENLRWQPVPVHTIPKSEDNIIYMYGKLCERYELEKDQLNKSPELAAVFEEHQQLIEYVSTHSGVAMTKNDINEAIVRFEEVYDTLLIETLSNLTISDWAREVYPKQMKVLADFSFALIAYTDEMRRLQGGPLLKTIVEDLNEKAAGGLTNRTFHIYSGHDTTIAVFLDTLDVFNRIAPPYSSAVLVELRQKHDDYFVAVFYRNTSEAPPYLLQVPGCKNAVCTLDEFNELSARRIPENWEHECDLGILVKLYYYTHNDLIVLGILSVVLLAVILTIVKLHSMRTRRYRHYQTIQDHVLHPEGIKLHG